MRDFMGKCEYFYDDIRYDISNRVIARSVSDVEIRPLLGRGLPHHPSDGSQ
jgi:hypothetical protein